MLITKIILHHSGGLGNDNFASTKYLVPEDIETYHKLKWNFKSKLGKYAGYNFIYDPKTRILTQHRMIGEETAHTKGQNLCSIGICIIGNYLVDPMDLHTKNDLINLLIKLCKNDFNDIFIDENAQVQITPFRIYQHSYFSETACPVFDVEWFKDQVKLRIYPRLSQIESMLEFARQLALKLKAQLEAMKLGKSSQDRECDGFVR